MPHTISDATSLANDCLALADDASDAAVEKQTELAGLAAMILARAGQSLWSTTILASQGFVGDAMSVSRTVIELAIDFAYIATDPDRLIPMYADYDHMREYELAQAVENMQAGTVSNDTMETLRQRAEKYIENNPESDRNWAGKSIKKRAELTGRQHMYGVFYGDTCGASHSGYTTLKYTLVGDPNAPRIHFGPMKPEPKPIILAAAAMIELIKIAAESCSIEGLEERWNDVNGRLKARPAG